MADEFGINAGATDRVKRERKRSSFGGINRETIGKRLVDDFLTNDETDRQDNMEYRIQRYAKYRQWTSGQVDYDGAIDAAVPDMTAGSQRTQDTLVNAVLSTRPPVSANSNRKGEIGKENLINGILDYQFFMEQNGEQVLHDMAECFTNDGVFTALVLWVNEQKKTSVVYLFTPIPSIVLPVEYFQTCLSKKFPGKVYNVMDNTDGWDWTVTDPKSEQNTLKVSFYTTDMGEVEMVVTGLVSVYQGPKITVKDYEDVLYPSRAANLQPPGPSNPGGASHVILLDYPTLGEIISLKETGYYDLMTEEDLATLTGSTESKTAQAEDTKQAIDDMQGVSQRPTSGDTTSKTDYSKTFTRMMVFDLYEVDGEPIDVIWWMIKETKTLLRAKFLTEIFPGNPPMRPLAESSFINIKGRRDGMSFLELVEGLHDLTKTLLDTTVNGGSLAANPFFFYRAVGSMKPEVIKLAPGDGYPLSNPQQDVHFPNISNNAMSFGINMLTMVNQMMEKVTMLGELQYGGIPAGQSSALRNTQSLMSVLQQGDARPERILRRYFMGLCQVYQFMHRYNQAFLPKNKQFRMSTYVAGKDDPYAEIKDPSVELAGDFLFDFKANLLNSSRAALQAALEKMMTMYINPMTMQMGMITPDGIWRLLDDWGKAAGQEPGRYIQRPSAQGLNLPQITGEEAISSILDGVMPHGQPLEPIEEHLNKLLEFQDSDNFGLLTDMGVAAFSGYIQLVQMFMMMQQQQQAMVQAAGSFPGGGGGAEGGGQPGATPSLQNAPVQGNELLDESMPTSGGGAN